MKFLLVFLLGMVSLQTQAQIAKWLIQPLYDNIKMAEGIEAIVTDSVNNRTVWTLEGQRVLSTKDELMPFKEGLALAVKPQSSLISTIFKYDGSQIEIKECGVTHNYPFFSNGKLLVKCGNTYKYVNSQGEFLKGDYVKAYPYLNGYASCDAYSNPEKKNEIIHCLIDDNGEMVHFSFKDKTFDTNDIQFVSSVNDERICVVVIKEKVYLYNTYEQTLFPVLENDSVNNLKSQAKIFNRIEDSFKRNADSLFELTGKCGKNGIFSIKFDSLCMPVSIKRNDILYIFNKKDVPDKKVLTTLSIKQDGGLYGLYHESKEMLPPQFEKVITCIADKALVKYQGKYGLVQLFPDESFKLRINKGDDIAFRHQKFETTIRADFSNLLPVDKVSIIINPETGCEIDKTSKESKSTESGNYVQYNCILNIPDSLPDELTSIEYPVIMVFDKLKSSIIPFKIHAWHYKYFVVDIDDSQTTLDKGTVSFVFNINAERIAGDGVYPTQVRIITDSLQYEYEKLSEIRHKCKVYELKEGVNNIIVQVIEQGCPPAIFPFEVEYNKPVAKTRSKPAIKERVTIKKKEKTANSANTNNDRPRVIM